MAAQVGKSLRPRDFFAAHRVFTHAEFVSAHTAGRRSEHTSNSLLAKHAARGRLLRVRRSLYAVVPEAVDPREFAPDPYLVATRLRDGAVVACQVRSLAADLAARSGKCPRCGVDAACSYRGRYPLYELEA